MQQPFRQTLIFTIALILCQCATLVVAPTVDTPTALAALALTATLAFPSLLTNWNLENERKKTFLLTERSRMLMAHLDARNGELRYLTRSDPLTSLNNRRGFDAAMARALAEDGPVALLMVDIDNFKSYNDHYGHLDGDQCLQQVAAGICAAVRDGDTAARLGGEEFAIVLPATGVETAMTIGERIRHGIESLGIAHDGLGSGRCVTISVGVAVADSGEAGDTEALAKRADAALYDAKRLGRNRVAFLDGKTSSGTSEPSLNGSGARAA